MSKKLEQSGNRSFQFERTNSEVNLRRLPELECTRYDFLGEDFRKMEMYLSDEVKEQAEKVGWGTLRNFFEWDLGDVASNRSSIDPNRGDDYAKQLRRVGAAEQISGLLEKPVAIKGTGKGLPPGHKDREDLMQQYLFMRKLQIDSKKDLPEKVKKYFRFCPVYGVMRYPNGGIEQYQEWLIMDRVGIDGKNGYQVRDVELGRPRSLGFSSAGFDPEEDPWLVEAFNLDKNKPTWDSLKMKLINMGLPVSDLAGRNILWTQDQSGHKSYTVIDQRKKLK